jgi:hypothetical protein
VDVFDPERFWATTSLRQAWLMNPSLRIVVVETATGQLSWPLPNEASSSCSAKWTRSLTEQRPQISRNPGVAALL